MILSKNRFVFGILYLLFTPLFLICIPEYSLNPKDWAIKICWYLLLLLAFQLLTLKCVLPSKRLLLYIVVIFFYCFHFSHILLYAIEYDFSNTIAYGNVFNKDISSVVTAVSLSIKVVIGVVSGIMIYFIFYKNEITEISGDIYYKNQISGYTMRMLLIIGFCFDFIYMILAYVKTRITYSGISSLSYPYILRLLSYMFLSAIVSIILNDNVQHNVKKRFLILFVIYKLISMITGLRAYALLNILIAVYIYYCKEKKTKISIKTIVGALCASQLIGGVLVSIRDNRMSGIKIGSIITKIFDIKSNVFFDLLAEFGGTLNVVISVISKFGGGSNGGKQLAGSLLSIIPGISYLIPLDLSLYSLEIAMQSHNIGGSYAADLIFDFGQSGCFIASIFLGMVFAFIFEKFELAIARNDIITASIGAPIVVDLLFCVRSSLSKMPRMIVWYIIIFSLLRMFFEGIYTRNVVNNY